MGRLTPGELLRLKQIASINAGNASESWQTLSEAQTRIAQKRTSRLGISVAVYPGATEAVSPAPPGFYAQAAAKIVIDGNLLPVEPDKLEIHTNSDHLAALSSLHGVFIHECGHANHSPEYPDLEGLSDAETSALVLLEEIRMEARVVEDNPSDAKWLRACARDIILADANVNSEHGAISAQVLLSGRVAAGSLEKSDVTALTKEIKDIIGEDVFKAVEKINKKTVQVQDGGMEEMRELARELAALFPKKWGPGGGGGIPTELIEKIKEELSGEGGDAGELEEILAASEALGAISDAARESSENLAGAASGSLPEKGERLPTDDERRARNDLFLKFREVRWRERNLVERSSALPPGRLNSRAAVQRSAEKSLGQLPSARPWRQKKRRMEEMPRLSCGVLIDTSGSMHYSRHELSGSLWAVSHAAFDTGGRVAAALFGNGSELLWGPSAAPPRHVTDINPGGGTDLVAESIAELDEALEWDQDLGPRLLVIVSDGYWSRGDHNRAAVEAARDKGVKVIQVGVGRAPVDQGANEIVEISDARDLAPTVGAIAIRELRNY